MGFTLTVLLCVCACAHDSNGKQPSAIIAAFEEAFVGDGMVNPGESAAREDAVLVVTRNATDLMDVTFPLEGTWRVHSGTLRCAPVGEGTQLALLVQTNAVAPVTPNWLQSYALSKPSLVGMIGAGDLGGLRLYIALCHKARMVPSSYRVVRVSGTESVLRVFIEGSNDLRRIDVEGSANAFLTFGYAVIDTSSDAASSWPAAIEVYTNGKRGYPSVPLRVRMGKAFRSDPEPTLKTDSDK
jgi:hypothetical protein